MVRHLLPILLIIFKRLSHAQTTNRFPFVVKTKRIYLSFWIEIRKKKWLKTNSSIIFPSRFELVRIQRNIFLQSHKRFDSFQYRRDIYITKFSKYPANANLVKSIRILRNEPPSLFHTSIPRYRIYILNTDYRKNFTGRNFTGSLTIFQKHARLNARFTGTRNN